MDTPFFIRTASKNDIPLIYDLFVTTWHETYDDDLGAQRVNEMIEEHHNEQKMMACLTQPNSEFLIADNGKIIGAMGFATAKNKKITLEQLYVAPNYQRQKIGARLLVELENAFPGCELITLKVFKSNAQAIGFYRAYGFQIIGEQDHCLAKEDGIATLILEKQIIYADDGGEFEHIDLDNSDFKMN